MVSPQKLSKFFGNNISYIQESIILETYLSRKKHHLILD